MKTLLRFLIPCLALCFLSPAHASDAGLDLLLLCGHAEMNFGAQPPLDARYQQMMADAGCRVTVTNERVTLTPEYLRQFNVVVYLNPSPFDGGGYFDAADWRSGPALLTVRRNVDTLRAYVEEGGGLLIVPALEELGMRTIESLQQLFAPYGLATAGATPRDTNQVWQAAEVMKGIPIYYGWTESFAQHPVSEGVRRIYYPSYCTRWDDNYTTIPLFPQDPAWVRLVDSSPNTRSYCRRGTMYDPHAPEIALPGLDHPAILVARDFGKGRVAVSGIGPFHLFYLTYNEKGRFAEANFVRIDGIAMEKGDGVTPSDLHTLLNNLYRWLAAPSTAAGMGGYDAAKGIAPGPLPYTLSNDYSLADRWAQDDPMVTGPVRPLRILVGAHSAVSDGTGTPAEWAKAAIAEGYQVVCFTEALEHLKKEQWPDFVAACAAASGPDVALMPGFDCDTDLDNRFLVIGKRALIREHLLTDDGRKLMWTGHLLIGMGDVQPVVARPQRLARVREKGALSPELYSHVPSVAVATYDRAGKLVDDGLFAYQALSDNGTHPYPVAVHEIYAPEDLSVASAAGLQNVVNCDTPSNAAFFFRQSHARSGGNPDRAYLSSGPVVDSFSITNWQASPWTVHLQAHSEAPITQVRVLDQRGEYRHFAPATNRLDIAWHGNQGAQHWFVTILEDAAGGRAILPVVRTLPASHVIRCTDRQNFFAVGLPAMEVSYSGRTRSAGRGPLLPEVPGVALAAEWCPKYRFPAFGPDFIIYESVYESTLVPGGRVPAADNDPIFNELPVPEFWAVRRFTAFMSGPKKVDARLQELTITLKQPLAATGEVWPVVMRVKPGSSCRLPDATGALLACKLPTNGAVELPAGAMVGDTLLLTALRADAKGAIGFPAVKDQTAPAGTVYHAQIVPFLTNEIEAARAALGLVGQAPFSLKLKQGKLQRHAVYLEIAAKENAAFGEVTSGPVPLLPQMPVRVSGVNPRWPVGSWRPGTPVQDGMYFEGVALLRLDVTQGGAFYLGNLLLADNPNLNLAFASAWVEDGALQVEVTNPTDKAITTTVHTPAAIKDHRVRSAKTTVPAGQTKVVSLP